MTLGERCDEIVRLIDETLSDLTGKGDRAITPTLGFEASKIEFPDDELDRVVSYERFCEIGRRSPVSAGS